MGALDRETLMPTLIEQLVGDSTGDVPVATLLRKMKVIASRSGVTSLARWVDHELGGYGPDDELPEYRGPFQVGARGDFLGPFNLQNHNVPIPESGFPDSFSHLFEVTVFQSVGELEQLATADKTLRRNWPADRIAYANLLIERGELSLYPEMGIGEAWCPVSTSMLTGVLEAVRNRILDFALEVEAIAPDAGEPGADEASSAAVSSVTMNIFGSGNNIAVASSQVTQSIHYPSAGNVQELLECARSMGVSDTDLDDLRAAAERPDDDEQRSAALQGWMFRYLARPAGTIAAGATGELLALTIAHFLGIA